MTQILSFVVTVGVVGILAHIVGEALPRDAFLWNKFPYAPYTWEEQGKFYNRKFHIERWKDHLPDKSKVVKSTVEKSIHATQRTPEHLRRLLQETCVAEFIHWALLVCSPILLLTMQGPWSIVMTVLYGLSNIPFIMIQRYNRPRLARLYARMGGGMPQTCAQVREKGIRHETADPVVE